MDNLSIKYLAHRIGLLLLEVFLFSLFAGLMLFFVYALWHSLGMTSHENETNNFNRPYALLLVAYLPQLIIFVLATYFVRVLIFKFPFQQSGLHIHKFAFLQFGVGWGLGIALVAIGFLLLLLIGSIQLQALNWNGYLFLGLLLLFLIQSAGEEVLVRGFLLPAIEHRLNTFWALFISSGIFALLHYFNPNVSYIAMANIFLGGLLMGLLFVYYRSIWASIGLHASWNFIQSVFFDFEVSGFDVYSFIQFKDVGNSLLNGGDFGYEGSIIAVALLAMVCAFILLSPPFKLRAEMLPSRKRI